MSLKTLFERKLLEARQLTVVGFFPGRFQPMHKGHKQVYEELRSMCGDNTYILTSDDTSSFKSPLSFEDKRIVMTKMCGIPNDKIIKVTSPYSVPTDLSFDEYRTVAIFAVSSKDMSSEPRFQFPAEGKALRMDGAPKYIQKYPGSLDACEPMATHAYVMEVDVREFEVLGKIVTSASELRSMLCKEEAEAREAFEDMYDSFDQEVFDLLRDRITSRALTIESRVILEGGNVWKNELSTRRIRRDEIKSTVQWLEKLTNLPLTNNLLGSTGLRPDSGDIDIAIDGKVSKSDLQQTLNNWATAHDEAARTARSGNSVHFRCPIKGDRRNGYVQVDFMFLPDVEFSKWAMAAPPSKYRAADRFIVLSSIAKSMGLKYSGEYGLVTRATNQPVDGGKTPATIARILLGTNATAKDLSTVESILSALRDDPARAQKLIDAEEVLRRHE